MIDLLNSLVEQRAALARAARGQPQCLVLCSRSSELPSARAGQVENAQTPLKTLQSPKQHSLISARR